MNIRYLALGALSSTETVFGSYSHHIRDRFCVDRTGFEESTCREIDEGVFRCQLPIESSLSLDRSLDCSDATIASIARRYEHQAALVRQLFDLTTEPLYYPESYIEFLFSTEDYSEINGRMMRAGSSAPSSRLLLAMAQISMLTSREFGSSTPYAVPVEDILGLRTMWRQISPPGSTRTPLMRGHARYTDSIAAFNTTIMILCNRTGVDLGLMILDHLLVNVPLTLTRLIAMGQMHLMGRFDYIERKRYLALLSDCLDAFQMMNDYGGDRAVPNSIIQFVANAAFSKDIMVMQRFHEPKLFVDITAKNSEIGPGFENLRWWGFLTNDVTQYLQSYIRRQLEDNPRETYDLESLEQVDLNMLSVDDYYFFMENLGGDFPRMEDDLERDVIMKYVNFLARHSGLDVPPECTLNYVMGRDIIDRIPVGLHHALSVLYKAMYCLDHPNMLFVIMKLIRFSQLEIWEYQYRIRDAFFAYRNTEYFESAQVDHQMRLEWEPDDNLVTVSIQFLCRSLYRSLGSKIHDAIQANQTDPPILTDASADGAAPATNDHTT